LSASFTYLRRQGAQMRFSAIEAQSY